MRQYFTAAVALAALTASAALADGDVAAPDEALFGASTAELGGVLAPACVTLELREVEVQIPGASAQSQYDCDGFDWYGAPRQAEFVFADDALALIWILIEPEELEPMAADFAAAYGAPDHDTAMFAAFNAHNAAVRREPAEALFYGEAVAEMMQGWFAANAGE